MPVNQPRPDYLDMLPKWQRLKDCFKGRDAILKAGEKYVPNLAGIDIPGNVAYRMRGNFYPALGRTVGGMNGAIFQTAPKVEVPSASKDLLTDITLTNVPFESFATEAGKEVFLAGRFGILVDMPTPPLANAPANAKPNVDMRPYCVGYEAQQIINWRTERKGGDNILTMVVLEEMEEVTTAEDPFTCEMVCQYRVLYLNAGKCLMQVWREKGGTGKKEYVMHGAEVTLMRRGEALTFVPFVFLGALKPTPDLDQPPLIDLADVNLGHWRNSVDYEYGLHLVALPTPWVAGAKGAGQGGADKKIGPSVVWELDVQGSAGMLEFTGAGLGSIATAMEEKKKQMGTLGARLLEDAPSVAETASAVRLRHAGETASLRTVAQSLEQGLTQMLQICVWWQSSVKTPNDATTVTVALNKEYLDIRATPQEIQVALSALQAGEISFETWYNLLATGGWAREGVDAEQEQEAIKKAKLLAPEPPNDPELSPPDPNDVPKSKTKTILDANGNVKYRIEENA